VIAIVGTPCRRAAETVSTMSDEGAAQSRLDVVERDEGRRRERNRDSESLSEGVLSVDRGVVARAAGGDQDVSDLAGGDAARETACDLGDPGAAC
jgi:hypothetical protein